MAHNLHIVCQMSWREILQWVENDRRLHVIYWRPGVGRHDGALNQTQLWISPTENLEMMKRETHFLYCFLFQISTLPNCLNPPRFFRVLGKSETISIIVIQLHLWCMCNTQLTMNRTHQTELCILSKADLLRHQREIIRVNFNIWRDLSPTVFVSELKFCLKYQSFHYLLWFQMQPFILVCTKSHCSIGF